MKILLLGLLLLGCAYCWPTAFEDERKCSLSESISLFDQTTSEKLETNNEEIKFMTEFARFMNYKAPELLQEFSQRKKLSEAQALIRKRQFVNDILEDGKIFRSIYQETGIKEYLDEQIRATRSRQQQREKRGSDVEVRQNEVVDAVEDAVEGAADTVVDAVEGAGDVVEDVAEGVADAAGGVADTAADVADDVVEGAGDVVDGVVGVVEDAGGAVGDLAGAAGDLVGNLIQLLTNSTTGVLDTFTDVVQEVGEAIEDNLPPNVWNAICVATWWPLDEEHCEAARCVACAPAITTSASVCKKSGLRVTHKCIEDVMGEGSCNFCIKEYLDF